LQVQEEDIAGRVSQRWRQGLSGLDLSDDLHVALAAKQRFQTAPEDGMIVSDYETD
jgi:hypothetical protein